MELELRKFNKFVDKTFIEGGKKAKEPVLMVSVAAIFKNPWHGKGFVEDLKPIILDLAPKLGDVLVPELIKEIGSPEKILAYGKAGTVGLDGEIEHASAFIHTLRFGNKFRDAVGGTSYLSFTNTRGPAGSKISIPIGVIETIAGKAEATRADGSKIILKQGTEIFSGDILETGKGASIGIVLEDDSTLSLAESGRMVMDDVVFDVQSQEGNATISVVQGVFSFVSGQIAKTGPDAMILKTPVATLGIRGTKVAGSAAAVGQANSISLLPDADGSVGSISPILLLPVENMFCSKIVIVSPYSSIGYTVQ